MSEPVATARSWLFVPGSRPDRYEKAAAAGADLVVIDLEDAVTDDAKNAARNAALSWAGLSAAVLRVNGVTTPWFDEDTRALPADARPRAVMLPKADAASVAAAADLLPGIPVVALVESARGLRDAWQVAEYPSVVRLAFGSVDYALDVGLTPRSADEDELLFARGVLTNASRAAGIAAPIDGVTVDLDDTNRIERDTRRARDLGFGGKLTLHPRQLDAVHRAFAPSDAEIDWARCVVDGVEHAAEGAFRLDGEAVDRPRVAQARRILASRLRGGEC